MKCSWCFEKEEAKNSRFCSPQCKLKAESIWLVPEKRDDNIQRFADETFARLLDKSIDRDIRFQKHSE